MTGCGMVLNFAFTTSLKAAGTSFPNRAATTCCY
jgi:hypothetical protein